MSATTGYHTRQDSAKRGHIDGSPFRLGEEHLSRLLSFIEADRYCYCASPMLGISLLQTIINCMPMYGIPRDAVDNEEAFFAA